jgi:hypothetical protein
VFVDYTTTGVFGSGPTSTSGGMTISFVGATGPIDAPSNIDLGQFVVTGLLPSGTFSDTFTLTVNQSQPLPGGSQSFGQASVSGTINVINSQAYVQFTSPLSVTIPGSTAVTYTIIEADGGVAGRMNLNPPGLDGISTTSIEGLVAVPVPMAAWGGIGLCGMLGIGKLRRCSAAVA